MTLQALVHLNVATLVDSFISLASAFALGSLIGFERQVYVDTSDACFTLLRGGNK